MEKRHIFGGSTDEDSDQPGHQPNHIGLFAVHLNLCIYTVQYANNKAVDQQAGLRLFLFACQHKVRFSHDVAIYFKSNTRFKRSYEIDLVIFR